MKHGNRRRVRPKIRHLAHWMALHAPLKNEVTEDEKCHNLMSWLIYFILSGFAIISLGKKRELVPVLAACLCVQVFYGFMFSCFFPCCRSGCQLWLWYFLGILSLLSYQFDTCRRQLKSAITMVAINIICTSTTILTHHFNNVIGIWMINNWKIKAI